MTDTTGNGNDSAHSGSGAGSSGGSGATATFHDWWQAARPHTWANAFAPVIAGTGLAAYNGGMHLGKALLALGVAWALIVGVNFANDYSDGVRGTDDDRTGPTRITASGLARPQDVKLAAFASFFIAGVLGVILAVMSAWWLVLVGAACIAAAWFYTGGKKPYGYYGFGELAVFVFFGLVAVLGTQFTQAGWLTTEGWLVAIAVGAISASVNLANNIRDLDSDALAGKNTLAVRLGEVRARRLFTVLTLTPFAVTLLLGNSLALVAFAALPFAVSSILTVQRQRAQGKDLIPVLGMNGRAMLLWSILTAAALTVTGLQLWGSGMVVPYTTH
ncbi:1,4-dihydroxy-2-naphthoate polyprenyltransferase [Corynebacterium imitans]|nr:1,4-dihydroxy-2-naphthoate polyprenyltransferase [Corynebacterium imitans]